MQDETHPAPSKFGHEVIQDYLKTLDGSPGVYRMLNAANEVLYVGKARNLRARVSNYARPSGHSGRRQAALYWQIASQPSSPVMRPSWTMRTK